MTDPALKRPLVFGDKEQIDADRRAAAKIAFDAVPNCKCCDGSGNGQCKDTECEEFYECHKCAGTGKTLKEYDAYVTEWGAHAYL